MVFKLLKRKEKKMEEEKDEQEEEKKKEKAETACGPQSQKVAIWIQGNLSD